jgi:hypothetical protein
MLITVIGRGHGGTRAMSHTLSASGVDMGPTNESGDLVPAEDMYEACRVMASHVRHTAELQWDFSALHTCAIPGDFTRLVESYLAPVLSTEAEHRGWKLPETTLVFPWIVRLFPDARYIHWVRDPRDSIIGGHLTDDLADFGIPYPATDDERLRRAISWRYQRDIVHATPKPKHWIEVRFEDFVLDQERTLARLETYLGIPLERIPVRRDSVGRWRSDTGTHDFPFFRGEHYEQG